MNTNSNLRLGYLVPQFPGQTHIFFWREIAELEERGVDIHLLSTQPPPAGLIAHEWSAKAMERTTYLASKNPFSMMRAAMHQPWYRFAQQIRIDGLSVARDIAICLPAAKRLLAYARRNALDHIHVHSCARAALIAAMCRHMGGPTFSVTLHGPMSDYGRGQPLKWRDASFATIITRKLEAEARDELGGAMPKKIYIRPMGVDTDVLKRDAPYTPPRDRESLRIFSCARLNVVKGHQDAMEAVRLLRARGVNAELEIAGEDDAGGSGYRKVLEARIAELGLTEHVRLLGAIDATAVKAKLLNAHLFVLASWHEPLGVAYMEAMSCGVPTIGTDSGGVPEMITSGETAILVPPKAPEQLADAIEGLSQNTAELNRLSHAGRAHIVAHFRASKGAETLIEGVKSTRG
ncbi:MAG: exopolysaccharide biosynthesis GT4 family glycosyltransferase EpsE [Planktotalea sp.]|uniref:exopolysaccharide biosynthesis GT4 family glycosyltransferase EpsE n=1 Tax=Planktotalea sp. TaxID=2029877 RepID=UPI003C74E74C